MLTVIAGGKGATNARAAKRGRARQVQEQHSPQTDTGAPEANVWTWPELLASEDSIVWLEPPEKAGRYLRESVIQHCRRRARPGASWYSGRLVGYSVLRPDAERDRLTNMFCRRIWWLAENDPYPGDGCPYEAVDPTEIQAGRASRAPRCRASREVKGSVVNLGDRRRFNLMETKEGAPPGRDR